MASSAKRVRDAGSYGKPSIFVNYRRADCGAAVQHLAEDLQRAFGPEQVFFDARSIEPGEEWPDGIQSALLGASVVIACIGKRWHLQFDPETGINLLDDPEDWVCREIELALSRQAPVIPLLLDGVDRMPTAALSARSRIAALLQHQALVLRPGSERDPALANLLEAISELSGLHLRSPDRRDAMLREIASRIPGLGMTQVRAESQAEAIAFIERHLSGLPEPASRTSRLAPRLIIPVDDIQLRGEQWAQVVAALLSRAFLHPDALVPVAVRAEQVWRNDLTLVVIDWGAFLAVDAQDALNPLPKDAANWLIRKFKQGAACICFDGLDEMSPAAHRQARQQILELSRSTRSAIVVFVASVPRPSEWPGFDRIAIGPGTASATAVRREEPATPQRARPRRPSVSFPVLGGFAVATLSVAPVWWLTRDPAWLIVACLPLLGLAGWLGQRPRPVLEVVGEPPWSPPALPEAVGPSGAYVSSDSIRPTMLSIPAGRVLIGNPAGVGHRDETPRHWVDLPSFLLARTPLTRADFRAAMPAGALPAEWVEKDDGDLPANYIDFPTAASCCNALSRRDGVEEYYAVDDSRVEAKGGLGYRLPGEAEWEYACRAGTTTRFWSGDRDEDLARVGWYSGNSGGKLNPVAQKPANAFGLHDMHGSVWEWCEDLWHDSYKGAPPDGRAWTDNTFGNRVNRGGSFADSADLARSASRSHDGPWWRYAFLGFRPARSLFLH